MKSFLLAIGVVATCCFFQTSHSLAQKGAAHPNYLPPPHLCQQMYQDDLSACQDDYNYCLKNGTPAATCQAQDVQCKEAAYAQYERCLGHGAAASTADIPTIGAGAAVASLSASKQSRGLLSYLAD